MKQNDHAWWKTIDGFVCSVFNLRNTGMILKIRNSVFFSNVSSYFYQQFVHNFNFFTLVGYNFSILFFDIKISPDPVQRLSVKYGSTEIKNVNYLSLFYQTFLCSLYFSQL